MTGEITGGQITRRRRPDPDQRSRSAHQAAAVRQGRLHPPRAGLRRAGRQRAGQDGHCTSTTSSCARSTSRRSRASPQLYEAWVTTQARQRTSTRSCSSTTTIEPDAPPPNDRNLVIDDLEVMGPYPDAYKQIIPREHTPEDKMLLAREIVNAFMTRAFRRPSTRGRSRSGAEAGRDGRQRGRELRHEHRLGLAGDAGLAPFPVSRRARSRAERSAGGAHAQRLRTGHAALVFPVEQHARRRAVRPGPARHAAQGRSTWTARSSGCCTTPRRRPWSRTSPASGCSCAT